MFLTTSHLLFLTKSYRSYSTKIQQRSLGVYYAYVVSSTVQQSSIAVLTMSVHVLRLLCYRGYSDYMLTLPLILIICLRGFEDSRAEYRVVLKLSCDRYCYQYRYVSGIGISSAFRRYPDR